MSAHLRAVLTRAFFEDQPILESVLTARGQRFGLPRSWNAKDSYTFPSPSQTDVIAYEQAGGGNFADWEGFSAAEGRIVENSMADARSLTHFAAVGEHSWDTDSGSYLPSKYYQMSDGGVLDEFIGCIRYEHYESAALVTWIDDYDSLVALLDSKAPELVEDLVEGQELYIDLSESRRGSWYSSFVVATESALTEPYVISLSNTGVSWLVTDVERMSRDVAGTAQSRESADTSYAVAFVDEQPILRSDFVARLEAAAGYNVLDQMITESLIKQAATKAGIVVSRDEVETEVREIRSQFGASYNCVLAEYGMTEDDLRTNIELNLLTIRYTTKDLIITEQDLRQYFEQNKDDYGVLEYEEARAYIEEAFKSSKAGTVAKLAEELRAQSRIVVLDWGLRDLGSASVSDL